MHLRALRSLAFGFLLAVAGSTAALAVPGKLTGVTASPNPAPKNTAVSVTLTKTGAGCGFKINFGDGPGVGPFVFTGGSKVMSHTYTQPGSYTIQAWGKAKGSKQACKGGTKVANLTITDGSGNGNGGGKIEIQRVPGLGAGKLELKKPLKAQLIKLATNATVIPGKDHAKFNVTANRKSVLKLRVFGLVPPPNRRCDETLPPLKATFALGKKKLWSTQILGLAPSKKHYWEVCAKDDFGDTAMASGTFKTGNRRVEVSFDMIKITDDSDDLGAGELTFIFEAGGKKKVYSAGEQDTGDLFFTGQSILLDPPTSQLSIKIRGGDNDGDGFISAPIDIPDGNHEDWGQINKIVSLSNEAGPTMYKWTAADHGLGFNAQVTVNVILD